MQQQSTWIHQLNYTDDETVSYIKELPGIQYNYFYQAWKDENSPMSQRARGLEPFNVLTTYIEQHSTDQLYREWSACNENTDKVQLDNTTQTHSFKDSCKALAERKYIVGVYSCPLEAGNRLHRFMNALLWAVLTNRTFLYRYHDYGTCIEYDEGGDMCSTRFEAHPSDCDNVLHITPWVASYDIWNERLQLSPVVRAQIHMKGQGQVEDQNTLPYDEPTLSKVIRTGWQFKPNPSNILLAKEGVSPHLSLQTNQQRLIELKSLGVYFVYGMLFEALFSLDPQLLPDRSRIAESTEVEEKCIWPERLCILKLMANSTKPCLVYLMSDRELALEKLNTTIYNETHCNTQTVENRMKGVSFRGEHGPYSGIGYWQDLAMASQARHGLIAFHRVYRQFVRTSTALVRERIEFRRILELHEGEELPSFQECCGYG